MKPRPTLAEFLALPAAEISKLVQETAGPQVCVLPVNGTRRWFLLEHAKQASEDWSNSYADAAGRQNIALCRTCIANGIGTLILPTFGGELLNRSDEYVQAVISNYSRLAAHPDFVSFYKEEQIRVHFYGAYRKKFTGTPFAHLLELFDQVTAETAHHTGARIFYGFFADNETEALAETAIHFYQQHGRAPSRAEMIKAYYGEEIEKANIFIGFEKFNVFDYPMLGWGEESLYYTIAPTPYITEKQLRAILYDHIYLRPVQDPDYENMPRDDWEAMRQFYITNREVTLGVGEMRGGIWYSKSGIQE